MTQEDMQFFERLFRSLETEMNTRFNGVDVRLEGIIARLDRMDATIALHGKHMAAGARAIAGWNDWTVKADEDYRRVLAELAELKLRIDKLEGPK